MLRLSSFIGAAIMVSGLSAAALGADLFNSGDTFGSGDSLRGSYPENWGISSAPDPLSFEIGLRYWYSLGSSQITAFGGNYSSSDKSHILEVHARIDDNSTSSYLKGQVGYAAVIGGTYTTPQFVGTQTISGGNIGYAGVDFGMLPFGNEMFKIGGFAGYQFLSDNPDMGRANFTTSGGSNASQTNANEIHMLKLGAAARVNFGDAFDVNAEAAIIPYAKLDGVYGAFYQPNFTVGPKTYQQGSAGTLAGQLYGASGEVMLGFHPTDNLTIRVGGRGWYLTGDATMSYTAREVGTPTNELNYIASITGLEFFRYGALAEITGSF